MRHAKARICRQAIYLWKPQWCPHKALEHLRFLPRQAEWFPPARDCRKRKKVVWEIERKLAEDGTRPIIFYNHFAYCWQPQVKGWTMMVNSIINNWRMEDVWLDR